MPPLPALPTEGTARRGTAAVPMSTVEGHRHKLCVSTPCVKENASARSV